MSSSKNLVLVIGGTGAQGIPVVKTLASDGKYVVRVLSRTAGSSSALELSALPGVTIFEGDSYFEPDLLRALVGVTHVFANTNGFAIGEKAETYWGIRLYELARGAGVKHFLYAGLEYSSKLGNFDPKYRCGHLDGKGKVVDYISAQDAKKMPWSVLTSCLYMEGLSEMLSPHPDPENPGVLVFPLQIGKGRCPLIFLEDYGKYARWIFDNPARSTGLELHVATEDIAWAELATAFTEVTGKQAVYRDITLDQYFNLGILGDPEQKVGRATAGDDATLFTIRENFSGFWNMWKDDLSKRDYGLLDEILPGRVRSVKEWMVKTGYTGEFASVLKDRRDAGAGST